MSAPTTVTIVDDCRIIKDSLAFAFSDARDMHLVDFADNGANALSMLEEQRPDIAIVDVLMPEMNRFEFAHRAIRLQPTLKVLFFSDLCSVAYLEHAKRIGAAGWIPKRSCDELVTAIRTIATSTEFYTTVLNQPKILIPILSAPRLDAEGKGALTEREKDVLRLWTSGLEVKEIAQSLVISGNTVEAHRCHIIRKTGTRSLASLTKLALALDLIPL